jgi:hypothetical protein
MRIDRLFAGASLREPGPGVYNRNPTDDGGLAASATVARAQERAFAGVEAAEEKRTAALVQQGTVIARAGEMLGGLGKLVAEIDKREAEQRRTNEFSGRRTQFGLASDANLRQAEAESEPDGRDLVQRFRALQDEAGTTLLAGVEDRQLAEALKLSMGQQSAEAEIRARQAASRKLADFSTAQLDQRTAALLSTGIAQRYEPSQRRFVVDEHESQLDAMARTGTLTQVEAQRRRTAFRETLLRGTLEAALGDGPATAQQALRNGTFDSLFINDAERAQSIKRLNQRAEADRAIEQTEFFAAKPGLLAAVRETGKVPPELAPAHVAAVAGAEEAKTVATEARAAKRWFEVSAEIATMLPEQAAAEIDRYKPVPGSANEAEQARTYATLQRVGDELRSALIDDPSGYVAMHFGAVPPDRSLAIQQTMGVPSENRALLSLDQARAAVDALREATGGRAAELVQAERRRWGAHWSQALRDLARAGLPDSFVTLAEIDDARGRVEFANAMQTSPARGRAALDPPSADAVDAIVPEELGPMLRVLALQPDRETLAGRLLNSSRQLAYHYLGNGGMAPREAAREAARVVALGRYDILEDQQHAVLTAKGQMRRARSMADELLASVTAEDLEPPPEPDAPKPQQQDYLNAVRSGRWVMGLVPGSSGDDAGEGWVRQDQFGRPVRLRDGKPLGFRLADVAHRPVGPPPPTSA